MPATDWDLWMQQLWIQAKKVSELELCRDLSACVVLHPQCSPLFQSIGEPKSLSVYPWMWQIPWGASERPWRSPSIITDPCGTAGSCSHCFSRRHKVKVYPWSRDLRLHGVPRCRMFWPHSPLPATCLLLSHVDDLIISLIHFIPAKTPDLPLNFLLHEPTSWNTVAIKENGVY